MKKLPENQKSVLLGAVVIIASLVVIGVISLYLKNKYSVGQPVTITGEPKIITGRNRSIRKRTAQNGQVFYEAEVVFTDKPYFEGDTFVGFVQLLKDDKPRVFKVIFGVRGGGMNVMVADKDIYEKSSSGFVQFEELEKNIDSGDSSLFRFNVESNVESSSSSLESVLALLETGADLPENMLYMNPSQISYVMK